MTTEATNAVPLRVVRGADLTADTAQSAGAVRVAGVSKVNTPETRIWMGKVSNEPGHQSVAHHHGDAETAGYVLKGRARIYYGENYEEYVDMAQGDFVFVPPNFPHIETNLSDSEELVWLTAR